MTLVQAAVPFSSSVQFYGSQQPVVGPANLRVIQQEFGHDMAVLTFWAGNVDSSSYASGMPMYLTWGRPGVKRTFYGYVSHPSRSNNNFPGVGLTGRNSVTLVCVGASFQMKENGTMTFRGQTASQVIRQIAALFSFDVNIVDHSQVWPVLHMAGMSYWEFCVMLAKRIGYTFYCSGTTLVFKPRQLDPSNITGYVTTYNYGQGQMPIFSPTLGATNPTGGELMNRHIHNIDLSTDNHIYATVSGSPAPTNMGTYRNPPIFDSIEHAAVHSQAEAYIKVNGMGRSNQLYITACASAVGNPLVAQGSLIIVNDVNGSQNGLWYVTRAEHQMDNKDFTLDMELGRDSLGANPSVISGVTQSSFPAATVLRNGMWAASV